MRVIRLPAHQCRRMRRGAQALLGRPTVGWPCEAARITESNELLAPCDARRGRELSMLSAMLGRKVGMTQIFGPNGASIPVTVIEAGPCTVTQVKTESTDGYEAVQLGYGAAKLKNTTRPVLGHLGHTLPATPAQRRRQQQQQAKARQEARQKTATASETASETEADVAEGASA